MQGPASPSLEVFNRKTKHLQKERAARNVETSRKTDYLKDEVATRLCERLLVCTAASDIQYHYPHLGSIANPPSLIPNRTSNAPSPTSSTSAPTAATSRAP